MCSADTVMHENGSNSLHAMSASSVRTTQIKFQQAFQFIEQSGSSGLMCADVQRQTSGHIFLDIHGIFFRNAKTQALQSSVHPAGASLRRPSKYETVGGFCETVSV